MIEYLNELMAVQKGLDDFMYRYQILIGASLGMMLVVLRNVPQMLWYRIVNTLTIRLVIDESDNMAGFGFRVFNLWIKENRIEWLTRSFEVDPALKVVGGSGFTAFKYKGRFFWTHMTRKETKGNINAVTIGAYTICTMKWNKHLLSDLVSDGCTREESTKTPYMYLPKYNDRWLDEGVAFPSYVGTQQQFICPKTYEEINNVFSRFASGKGEYIALDLPFKETIMLYGPPGTGKTNLLRHLSAKYNFDLISINPADLHATSFKLQRWSHGIRLPRVFLIEDIDSNKGYHLPTSPAATTDKQMVVVKSDAPDNVNINGGGSLTDLLNALDGIIPLDDCIVVMTTNRLELLEPSIYRPGRVDHLVYMGYMTAIDVLKILKWSDADPRTALLKSSENHNRLPAATINQLRYAKTADEVSTILENKEAAIGFNNHDKAA